MRAPVDIDDPKYRGKVVSSRTIFEREEEESDEEAGGDATQSDDDRDGQSDDDGSAEEEEEEFRLGDKRKEADEVDDIEAEQEADLIRMVSVNPRDRDRAAHARNQRELTDAALELRIRMQKPLSLAARLPRGPVLAAFAAHDPGAAAAAAAAAAEAVGFLGDLMSLRAALWLQVKSFFSAASAAAVPPAAAATLGGNHPLAAGGMRCDCPCRLAAPHACRSLRPLPHRACHACPLAHSCAPTYW